MSTSGKSGYIKIITILLFIVICNCTISEGGGLSEVIGEVAATLLNNTAIDPVGSNIAAEVARGWNDLILTKSIKTPDDAIITYQKWENADYDVVQYEFTISKQTIITKQTIFVMVVSLPGQDTVNKTIDQLREMIHSLAQQYLGEFDRQFVSVGNFDNTEVFTLLVDKDHCTGDWRDTIVATVKEGVISFCFNKKKSPTSAARVSDDPNFNKKWFDLLTRGQKIQ